MATPEHSFTGAHSENRAFPCDVCAFDGYAAKNATMTDFALMTLEQRRDALLALSRSTDPVLGMLGLEPSGEQIYVMSTDENLVAGTYIGCLAAAAASLGMNVVAEPLLLQGGDDAPDSFEVWADMCGTPTRLASATTNGEALAILKSNLAMLAGDMAMTLADWLELQRSDPSSEESAKARRSVQWAHSVTLELVGRVRRDGWVSWTLEVPTDATKVRHKQARAQLLEAGSLRRIKEMRTVRRYELRAVELDGYLYANFHDLARAARDGVDVSFLRPWPYCDANAFVINREYQRYLRSQGWRMLCSGEEPTTPRSLRHAAGGSWMRDEPGVVPSRLLRAFRYVRQRAIPSSSEDAARIAILETEEAAQLEDMLRGVSAKLKMPVFDAGSKPAWLGRLDRVQWANAKRLIDDASKEAAEAPLPLARYWTGTVGAKRQILLWHHYFEWGAEFCKVFKFRPDQINLVGKAELPEWGEELLSKLGLREFYLTAKQRAGPSSTPFQLDVACFGDDVDWYTAPFRMALVPARSKGAISTYCLLVLWLCWTFSRSSPEGRAQ